MDLLQDATIVATLQGEKEFERKMLLLRPVLEGGRLTWVCGTPDESFYKHVTAECRHKLQPDRAHERPAALSAAVSWPYRMM